MHGKAVRAALGALAVSFLFLAAALPTEAAKPQSVQKWSNGFPSGEHYNLNIHGKKDGFTCDGSAGGGSVFTPEYGTSEIQFMQNKKAAIDGLTVHDACAGFDGDAAMVQLPSGEYQVYTRILAKPQKADEARSVVFYPKLIDACNDSGTANFTNATDCTESWLMGSGVVTKDGVFDKDSESLTRLAPAGKGKNLAVDVSPLFQWSGWACDQAYDTDGDGAIGIGDLNGTDLNGDGLVDEADLALYLETNCTYFANEWVFNIADLVVYGWDYRNNGSKLLQVRFYPVATTTFG